MAYRSLPWQHQQTLVENHSGLGKELPSCVHQATFLMDLQAAYVQLECLSDESACNAHHIIQV